MLCCLFEAASTVDRPAIVAITAVGDPQLWAMHADAPDQLGEVTADLLAGWRLARSQQHRHEVSAVRVIDMDRQEASLVIVRIE